MAKLVRSWPTRAARAIAWSAGVLALLLAAAWWAAAPSQPDAFYDPPAPLPDNPGSLIRAESFTTDVPAGAVAWRILYTTTRISGAPTVASAIVMARTDRPAGPRPALAWAHGTTGIEPGCAPSVTMPFANVPALEAALREGWIYVATDYAGLGTGGGHAYLIGDEAGRAVLDAVRAARRVEGLELDGRAVVWGHSQGGNSALWTGIRAADYAPDVKLLGVAALAPASDLSALFSKGRGSMFGKIVSAYVLAAYPAAYPDVKRGEWLAHGARPWARDIASRCIGGAGTLLSVAGTMLLPADGLFSRDPANGTLGARLLQNTPTLPIAAPVLIAQGDADDLVLPEIQAGYVAERCAAGQPIDYRPFAGLDHLTLVAPDSPLEETLIGWTRDRLAGLAARSSCGPRSPGS